MPAGPAPAPPPPPDEAGLAAAALRLLAQPALWKALRLPPADAVDATAAPWTAYWATCLDAAADPATTRDRLERAWAAFGTRGDRIGRLACAAAIVEGFYFEEGPLHPLDRWVHALRDDLPAEGAWPSLELEARVIACGTGLRLREPGSPLVAAWAARGAQLMRQVAPGALRLKLATFLAQYHLWRGEAGRTALVVDALPGLEMDALLPGEAVMWLETVAIHARCSLQFERGIAALDSALAIVERHALRHHAYALHAHGASLALAAHDLPAARRHLEGMRPALEARPQADQTHYWHLLAGLALLEGDAARAVELARTAFENAGEIGGPYRSAALGLGLGQALLRAGEAAAALERLDAALAQARSIDAALLVFSTELMRAAALLRLQRRADALQALRSGFGEGARREFRTTASWWLPDVMAALAQAALAADIEPAYVRAFARRHALPGTDPALAAWPWALTLRAFGEFELLLDDAPLPAAAGAKTAQRPLDLLRALLAHGGSGLPVAVALQWLWPEADAAAQRKAFDVALLRLRRLLGDASLVQLEGGRLRLDAQRCWSDVGALQALLHDIGSAHGVDLPALQEWGRRLLALMRGPFLAGDDADWARAARERYRQRFVVCVAQLASHIEALDTDAAVRLYEHALDADPLAESLARRLMRLHAARGDRAEALRIWRACNTMLQLAEGLPPSRDTCRLAAELGLA